MDTITAIPKPSQHYVPSRVLSDDLIFGTIKANMYVVDIGVNNIIPLEVIIETHRFPLGCAIVAFVSGHNQELFNKMELY